MNRRIRSRWLLLPLFPLLLWGCSASRLPEAYLRGTRLEAQGNDEAALAAYEKAAGDCRKDRSECWLIRLRRAQTLARLRRTDEAIRAYLELGSWTRDAQTASRAQERAAGLLEEQPGGRRRAFELSRQTILDFPDEVAAEDSLRRLLRLTDVTRHDATLLELLLELFAHLQQEAIAPQVLFAAAQIYERNRRPEEALALFDRLAQTYPKSPLRDDSLWRAAQILEAKQRWAEAVRRYQRLLLTRKDALFMGSYNSIYLDDAQLRLGQIKLDHLGDLDGAMRAFLELRDDFPTSLLRDDAQWWLAQVYLRRGDRQAACRELERLLRDFSQGNQVHKAQETRATLGCDR